MRRTPGLTIRPSGAPLGAEIVGVDLAEDLEGVIALFPTQTC
jgi:hypothetical protein